MLILHAAHGPSGFVLFCEAEEKASLASLELSMGPVVRRTAWLPSVLRRGQPAVIPSDPVLGPSPPGKVGLRAFSVESATVEVASFIELLSRCEAPTLHPGVLIGVTLRFWSQLLRFAANLTARGRMLPALQGDRAIWEPVLIGQDRATLQHLNASMPHACRCLGDSQPEGSNEEVCRSALRTLVHQLTIEPGTRATGGSLHQRWLDGLKGSTDLLGGDLAGLARSLREWRHPLALLADSPYRLCLRLQEPIVGDRWSIDYLLQEHQDPSHLIEAREAWQGPGRETLLASLGMAARLGPLLEPSLRAANPTGIETDAEGAFQFLSESAELLEQAGFAVMLPSWWTRSRKRLALKASAASPPMRGKRQLSLSALIQVDWQVMLGDQEFSRAELEALAAQKQALVRVRGQWVVLRPDETAAALKFLRGREARMTLGQLMNLQLGGATEGLVVQRVQADGPVGDFLARLQEQRPYEQLPPETGFHGQLRPYQLRGYSWILFLRSFGLGACLADDMGLGKTVQTLAALWQNRHLDGRPTLLVCPTSVLGNWEREAARFTPELSLLVHHGPDRHSSAGFCAAAERHALVLTSYALLQRDIERLASVEWSAVVLDEAQNIKNANAKQSKAARQLRADFRLALTGTPVENHVGDLWSLMEFLQPGLLGNRDAFKRNYFQPIQSGPAPEAAAKLKRLTGPFVLRRLKTDRTILTDLPDKLETKVLVSLTREQASLYEAVVKEAIHQIESSEGIQRKGLVLSLLARLKQVCNHPAHYLGDHSSLDGRSGKLARLRELVEELLEVGDRALIFTQYFEMGHLLRRYLQENFGREVLFLHGGLTKKLRDQQVERFQAGEVPLFLLSLKAGGTGLNLTAANHVFHYDRWWNPAVENQATDRAFRIGQKRCVQVHKFVCTGTVEEKIDQMIEKKHALAQSIVGTGEGWLTEFSSGQLRELFELSRDA